MIKLSPADAELLKMNHLQLAAKTLRNGGAPDLANVCDRANTEIERLRKALSDCADARMPGEARRIARTALETKEFRP